MSTWHQISLHSYFVEPRNLLDATSYGMTLSLTKQKQKPKKTQKTKVDYILRTSSCMLD